MVPYNLRNKLHKPINSVVKLQIHVYYVNKNLVNGQTRDKQMNTNVKIKMWLAVCLSVLPV